MKKRNNEQNKKNVGVQERGKKRQNMNFFPEMGDFLRPLAEGVKDIVSDITRTLTLNEVPPIQGNKRTRKTFTQLCMNSIGLGDEKLSQKYIEMFPRDASYTEDKNKYELDFKLCPGRMQAVWNKRPLPSLDEITCSDKVQVRIPAYIVLKRDVEGVVTESCQLSAYIGVGGAEHILLSREADTNAEVLRSVLIDSYLLLHFVQSAFDYYINNEDECTKIKPDEQRENCNKRWYVKDNQVKLCKSKVSWNQKVIGCSPDRISYNTYFSSDMKARMLQVKDILYFLYLNKQNVLSGH